MLNRLLTFICLSLVESTVILFESSAKVVATWQECLRLDKQTTKMGLSSTLKKSVGEALFQNCGFVLNDLCLKRSEIWVTCVGKSKVLVASMIVPS